MDMACLKARGFVMGVPNLVARDDEAFVVLTDIANGSPFLRGARIGAPR